MPKVLIITGDAAESLEVMYPYQRLLEEGYEVDIAAPSAKKLQFVVHDFVDGFDTYTEKLEYTWPADVAFADVSPAGYVALVIPGGRAPEFIRNDPDVQRIARHFIESDQPVAQLCHAP
jgi:deglycase